jgi:uncharacterized protein YneF (UPF0154 family)
LRWKVVSILVLIILMEVLAGVIIYHHISVGHAKVMFHEFPCASMAKPDRVVKLNGFTFYVYVPLSHEGFLNMSIAEKARYHPLYAEVYCFQQIKQIQSYLESHPQVKDKLYSALQ